MATYYLDPTITTEGDGSGWGDTVAFKKLYGHSFAAGDTIKVAKSAETAAAGTVTATQGSVAVATTNDLSGVIGQYSVIHIGGDDTLYLVKASTNNSLTLYRPYRGTSGSGKGLTYYTGLPTSASNDWQPTAMTGTAANPITIQGGINTGTGAQDGFTVLYGNNASYLLNGTYTFADLSRIASLYFSYPWNANLTDCTLNNCFAFRSSTRLGLNPVWRRIIVNGFVSDLGKWHAGVYLYGCTLSQIETAEDSASGWSVSSSSIFDTVINQWRNAGYTTSSMYLDGNVSGARFNDAIFDELAAGGINIRTGTSNPLINNMVFQNPQLGSGTVLSLYSSSYYFLGSIGMSHVGGSATDHRTYLGFPEGGKYALLSYDAAVYRNAAPSSKITLYQASFPTIIKHFIPCDAGVQKTVSAYLRKNSSYGSATRPTMRLRWLTGTAGNLSSNVHDEVMSDVNDTWEQVSYAVTPAVTGAIVMELIFQSANSGAIAWYDDIGAQ